MSPGKHHEFLISVYSYVKKNPDVAGKVSDYVTAGIQEALQEAYERAADMEVAAAVMLTKRVTKGDIKLSKSKIEKWRHKSALRWDWLFEEE